MHSHYDARAETRGTVLVASSHLLFTDLVGEMVSRCGFSPAYPVGQEAAWLSLTRTQPCIVICDCSAPADGIERLMAEASTRHIPLVLSDARMQQRADEGSLVLPDQVTWLTFPVSRDQFAAMLDAALRPAADIMPARIPAAVSKRARRLVLVPRDDAEPRDPDNHADRSPGDGSVDVDTPAIVDARNLRSAVAAALAARPVYVESLRRAVWTYVGAERDAGTSPGQVVTALTELVDAAGMAPPSMSRALTGRVILWCVEAYFGQLGCDVGRATAEQTAEQGDFSSAHDESEVLVGALPA